MKVEDLLFDERNYRNHKDKNKKLIRKSIKECGFGRSVIIDNENRLIGGNGVVSQVDKNTPIKVIETDGTELVVVKRTDLKTGDEKRKKLAVLDNSTSDTSEFDNNMLITDFNLEQLVDLGVEIKGKKENVDGEVPFTEELLEEHNYIVLYFDNSVDWLQAQTLFGDFIKKKQALNSKDGYRKMGVGRVVRGADFLKEITK